MGDGGRHVHFAKKTYNSFREELAYVDVTCKVTKIKKAFTK